MSAKHKRPFYVFAAVAAVCCMVLVTGIRGSKADDGRIPVFAGSSVADTGAPIAPIPGADDSAPPAADPGASGGDGTGLDGSFDPTTPGLSDSGSGLDAGGGDAESGPDSGVIVLPPVGPPLPDDVDPGDVSTPPADPVGGKGHGPKGDKKDKDKDEQGNQSDDESEADAESEDEVDPDVYGVEDEGETEEPGDNEPTGGVTP